MRIHSLPPAFRFMAFDRLTLTSRSGLDNPLAQTPLAFSRFWLGPSEWGMFTEPQENAGGRKRFWPRGASLCALLRFVSENLMQCTASENAGWM